MSDDKNERKPANSDDKANVGGKTATDPAYTSNEADPAAGPADRKPDPSLQPT